MGKRAADAVITIATYVLFALVAAYLAYHIRLELQPDRRTVDAVVFKVEETSPVTAFFVRDEIIVGTDGEYEPSVPDGSRVGKNDPVASLYGSANLSYREAELKTELERRVSEAEYAASPAAANADASRVDAALYSALTAMLDARDKRSAAAYEESCVEFKAQAFRRAVYYGGARDYGGNLAALKGRIAALGAAAESGQKLYAPVSGLFTSALDGWENALSVASLKNMTAADFSDFYALRDVSLTESGAGKIAAGFNWRVVILADSSAAIPKAGSSLTLRFSDISGTEARFTVERADRPDDDGRVLAVLNTSYDMSAFINSRSLPADILEKSYTGLRVPKEALRLEESSMKYGVYCVTGERLTFKPVNVVVTKDNYYLAEFDPKNVSGATLLPGDEMILGGGNLRDGMVIK